MPTDNVFPISARASHPESVPDTSSRQRRFRWFVAGLAVVWAGALAAAIAYTPFPAIWPLLAFAALVIAAEHRFILFGDETSMSASIVVILCAITYWRNDAYLVGPMLVATCGGLLLPHLRNRSWDLVAANGSIFSLSACLASIATFEMPQLRGLEKTAMSIAIVVLIYWTTNSFLTGSMSGVRNGSNVPGEIRNQFKSDIELTLIAAAGASIGFAATNSLAGLAFLFVPLALMPFTNGTPIPSNTQMSRSLSTLVIISIGVFSSAIAGFSLVGVACVLSVAPLAIQTFGMRSIIAAGSLGALLAVVASVITNDFVVGLAWITFAITCGPSCRVASQGRLLLRNGSDLDRWVLIGFVVPDRSDMSGAAVATFVGLGLLWLPNTWAVAILSAVVSITCALTMKPLVLPPHFAQQASTPSPSN